ncbi:adenylyl-sulfate kinase, partial [Brevundimonas sp. MYb27]
MDGAVTAFPPQTQRTERDLLRFLTCGSVDDGKSTLIGRLLFETGQVPEDQLATLERDSRRFGTDGTNLDYALLLDGLEAEREQGITIDVAYRYMSTPRRSFIVADTPGHEQYTRNMATGASTCDAAVVLVDAVKGVTAQTARHSRIVALFGIRHVILAVNKIDLVADDPAAFEAIRAAYADLVADLGFSSVTAIPVSARRGDNLTGRSAATPWYEGPSLIEALEDVPVAQTAAARPFRLSIQYVNRPHADFRGYAGTIASGEVRVGDALVVCPGGQAVTLARILSGDVEVAAARAGEAVTLVLAEDTDVARGDVLAHAVDRPAASDRLNVRL